MASDGHEFGISTGGALAPLTDDHEVWGMKNDYTVSDTSTMPVSIISDGSTMTLSLGNNVSAVSGTFVESSSIDLTGFGSFTTLWFGLESKEPNNSFRMINTAINGENIATTEANGVAFAGFYAPVGSSFSALLELQADHTTVSPFYYSLSDAGFYTFGDNTLDSIPEPSSTALLGIASTIILFRRKRR